MTTFLDTLEVIWILENCRGESTLMGTIIKSQFHAEWRADLSTLQSLIVDAPSPNVQLVCGQLREMECEFLQQDHLVLIKSNYL